MTKHTVQDLFSRMNAEEYDFWKYVMDNTERKRIIGIARDRDVADAIRTLRQDIFNHFLDKVC